MKRVFLALLIATEAVVIYFLAFENWKGPGDWGSNLGYLPAVMVAAGRGLTVTDVNAIPELKSFIAYETTHFDVDLLPADLQVRDPGLEAHWYQYLLYTVGYLWRVFGVSWNLVRGLTVLFLFLAGFFVYGICRLALPVSWSLLSAHAFCWNLGVLNTLVSFRDFSKAAFILCAIWLLGNLIKQRSSVRKYLVTACLLGLVLGVGLGFRRDMQVVLPISILILLTCRLQPPGLRIVWRISAALIASAVFTLVSYPVVNALYPKRWVNAHDTIMGFSSDCESGLRPLQLSSCQKHYLLHDGYSTSQAVYAAHRGISMTREEAEALKNSDRDVTLAVESAYVKTVATLFPADMIARTYATVLACFRTLEITLFIPFIILELCGFIFVVIGLLILAALDLYLASQIALMLMLFCAYTSLQFGLRHAFHLSFIPYWFGCFCLYYGYKAIRSGTWRLYLPGKPRFRRVGLAILWMTSIIVVLYVPLAIARAVQVRQVSRIVEGYREAPRAPVPHTIIHNWEGQTLLCPKNMTPCEDLPEENMLLYAPRMRTLAARFSEGTTKLNAALIFEWDDLVGNYSGVVRYHVRPGQETHGVNFYFSVYESFSSDCWYRFAGLLLPDDKVSLFEGFSLVSESAPLGFYGNLTIPDNPEAFEPVQHILLPWPNQLAFPYYVADFLSSRNYGEIKFSLASGKAEQAIALCNESLKYRPSSMQFQTSLAQGLLQAGRDPEAWEVIDTLLNTYPEDHALYARLDIMFVRLNDAEKRIAGWRRIAESRPDSQCALYFLRRVAKSPEPEQPEKKP